MQLLSQSKELLVCGYAITVMFCVVSNCLGVCAGCYAIVK